MVFRTTLFLSLSLLLTSVSPASEKSFDRQIIVDYQLSISPDAQDLPNPLGDENDLEEDHDCEEPFNQNPLQLFSYEKIILNCNFLFIYRSPELQQEAYPPKA